MVEQVVLWCDWHFHQPEQKLEFATAQQHGWEGTWLEVHLCEECKGLLLSWTLAEAVEFFRDYGEDITERLAERAKVRSGAAKHPRQNAGRAESGSDTPRLPCLYCPKDFGGRQGLERHLSKDHGLSDFWGTICPLCGGSYGRLAQHASRGHDMHISLAFAQADAEGDPHGALAARRKEVLSV